MGSLDPDTSARVSAAIAELAKTDLVDPGMEPGMDHICRACAHMMAATGANLSLISTAGSYEPVYASEPRCGAVAELQVVVGEGPGVLALGEGRLILVPALDTVESQRRWPLFAPGSVDLGIRAVFAFPLMVGAIAVGVLEICRNETGPLGDRRLGEALLFADAALMLVLTTDLSGAGTQDGAIGWTGSVDRWPEVHQATGMMSVQLGTGLASAFMRLRAHTFASGRSLREVSRDVVDRKLRFEPEE
ncbi:MAG: GAF and ANTAR domain-containing protein [Streptosporangiaceae bacterium]